MRAVAFETAGSSGRMHSTPANATAFSRRVAGGKLISFIGLAAPGRKGIPPCNPLRSGRFFSGSAKFYFGRVPTIVYCYRENTGPPEKRSAAPRRVAPDLGRIFRLGSVNVPNKMWALRLVKISPFPD